MCGLASGYLLCLASACAGTAAVLNPDALGSSSAVPLPAQLEPAPASVFNPPVVLARDLRSPDGVALDAGTGMLYVSEEDVAAIVRIAPDGKREVLFDASTAIYEMRGGRRVRVGGMRSLEGLALDGQGTLYVVEDVPGGRLLAFNIREIPSKSRRSGTLIPLPTLRARYAWESIAVGPAGELLMAGSTLEAAVAGPEALPLFRGAVLYRDTGGEWWMPMSHSMASYSAAAFSPDGNLAYFACEVTGAVGCLDLRPRFVRIWFSNKTFKSPEGLCALPGGAVLVAEEGGGLHWWDPTTDRAQQLYDHAGAVESVLWDSRKGRVLITADQAGELLALEFKTGLEMRPTFGRERDIPFTNESSPLGMIPDDCPAYLADILKMAGYLTPAEGGKLSFRDFARRYCMIAIDAETKPLMSSQGAFEDPIERIQFVVVAPYMIGYLDGELIWSASGFTVIRKSGEVMKTELVKRHLIQGDMMEGRVMPMGAYSLALPVPFSARIDSEGLVSVNFMGMGIMNDFYLVLDSEEPDDSVMVVIQPDGAVHQYQVGLPNGRDRRHWVVALERQGTEAWKRLPLN